VNNHVHFAIKLQSSCKFVDRGIGYRAEAGIDIAGMEREKRETRTFPF
jgi:hypothetical protein